MSLKFKEVCLWVTDDCTGPAFEVTSFALVHSDSFSSMSLSSESPLSEDSLEFSSARLSWSAKPEMLKAMPSVPISSSQALLCRRIVDRLCSSRNSGSTGLSESGLGEILTVFRRPADALICKRAMGASSVSGCRKSGISAPDSVNAFERPSENVLSSSTFWPMLKSCTARWSSSSFDLFWASRCNAEAMSFASSLFQPNARRSLISFDLAVLGDMSSTPSMSLIFMSSLPRVILLSSDETKAQRARVSSASRFKS
mmetsp:Transcript_15722/g.27568  ORF Transcript_15722/g.27568 Transcript_15722/m.27568 type:complete len:256 (-) Transcript_15722:467-1234(-)